MTFSSFSCFSDMVPNWDFRIFRGHQCGKRESVLTGAPHAQPTVAAKLPAIDDSGTLQSAVFQEYARRAIRPLSDGQIKRAVALIRPSFDDLPGES